MTREQAIAEVARVRAERVRFVGPDQDGIFDGLLNHLGTLPDGSTLSSSDEALIASLASQTLGPWYAQHGVGLALQSAVPAPLISNGGYAAIGAGLLVLIGGGVWLATRKR